MQEITAATGGADAHRARHTLSLDQADVGGSLLIAESDERPDPALDDERRRYYRLTGFGRRVAQAEALRLAQGWRARRRRDGCSPALAERLELRGRHERQHSHDALDSAPLCAEMYQRLLCRLSTVVPGDSMARRWRRHFATVAARRPLRVELLIFCTTG